MLTVLAVVVLHASPAVTLAPKEGAERELSGLVRDERGDPIAGAKVMVMGGTHHRMERKEAVSGPDGRFVVSGAPRGMYGTSLGVTAEGFFPVNDSLALEGSGAFEVTVTMGRPARLTGRIVAADATAGGLRLIHPAPDGTEPAKWRSRAVPVTTGSVDGSGAFTLDAPAGRYELEWLRPSGSRFFALVEFPANDVTLQAPGEQLEISVLTSASAPVQGVKITVGRNGVNEAFALGETDSSGRFVAFGLPEGTYRVDFLAEGRCRSRPVTVKGPLTKLSLRTGTGWTLSGVVVDGDGKPVVGADVSIDPLVREPMSGLCGFTLAVLRTDEEGRFSASDLEPAEVKLNVSGRRSDDFQAMQLAVKKGAAPLKLTLVKGVARTVTGVVLGPDRQPIEGAMVGSGRNWTDASGRFTLERTPKDPATLEVYKRCFERQEVPEAKAATVVMKRRPCLSVNVMSARQRVPGFHSLTLRRADGTQVSTCTTRQQEGDCTMEAELGVMTIEGTLATGGTVSSKVVKVTGVEKTEVYLEVKR